MTISVTLFWSNDHPAPDIALRTNDNERIMIAVAGFKKTDMNPIVVGGAIADPQNRNHLEIVRRAGERGLYLHSSLHYPGNLETIARAIKENPALKNALKVISKVSVNNDNRGTVRQQVEQTLLKTGLGKIHIVQVCCNPSAKAIKPGMPFFENMKLLVKEGKVETYYPEIYWQYSSNMDALLDREIFPGFIFYYNIIHREATKKLFCKMRDKGVPFIALRALGGGVGNYYERTILHPKLEQLKEIVKNSPMSEIAFRIAFLKAKTKENLQSFVLGTQRPEHLEEAIDIFESIEPLGPEIVAKIERCQDELWKTRGCGNGLGLHRKFGRMALKNTAQKIKTILKGGEIGHSW